MEVQLQKSRDETKAAREEEKAVETQAAKEIEEINLGGRDLAQK